MVLHVSMHASLEMDSQVRSTTNDALLPTYSMHTARLPASGQYVYDHTKLFLSGTTILHMHAYYLFFYHGHQFIFRISS
jgi:hypothetical protein